MLEKETTGLIVIDIQGKLARIVDDSEGMISQCEKLIQGCQGLGLPVLWLEQNPQRLGSTVEELRTLQTQPVFEKFTFDGCKDAQFAQALAQSGIQHWLVCGIETHICVYQTVQSLIALGYQAHVVSDCVSSRSKESKALALNKMTQLGAKTTNVEMCLYEILQDCRAPEFKSILQLIK